MRTEKDGAEYPDPTAQKGLTAPPKTAPKHASCLALLCLIFAVLSWGGFAVLYASRGAAEEVIFMLGALFAFGFTVSFMLSIVCGLGAILAKLLNMLFRRPMGSIRMAWIGLAMTAIPVAIANFAWVPDYFRYGITARQHQMMEHVKADQEVIDGKLEERYRAQGAYDRWRPLSSRKNQIEDFDKLPPEVATLPTFEFSDEENAHVSDLNLHPAQYRDVFTMKPPSRSCLPYAYYATSIHNPPTSATAYIVWSCGPDGKYDLNAANIETAYNPARPIPSAYLIARIYDPSNGATSAGDIVRYKTPSSK